MVHFVIVAGLRVGVVKCVRGAQTLLACRPFLPLLFPRPAANAARAGREPKNGDGNGMDLGSILLGFSGHGGKIKRKDGGIVLDAE
ncbi:hypothetical protein JTE90_024405, partial [Oedothorax gibbosus]